MAAKKPASQLMDLLDAEGFLRLLDEQWVNIDEYDISYETWRLWYDNQVKYNEVVSDIPRIYESLEGEVARQAGMG